MYGEVVPRKGDERGLVLEVAHIIRSLNNVVQGDCGAVDRPGSVACRQGIQIIGGERCERHIISRGKDGVRPLFLQDPVNPRSLEEVDEDREVAVERCLFKGDGSLGQLEELPGSQVFGGWLEETPDLADIAIIGLTRINFIVVGYPGVVRHLGVVGVVGYPGVVGCHGRSGGGGGPRSSCPTGRCCVPGCCCVPCRRRILTRGRDELPEVARLCG